MSPAQLASLRALANRVMSPISASMTSAVNSPDAGQRGQDLDPRVGLGVLAQLAVDPVDHRRQAVDHRQAVGDDLPRHRGQVQLGQPAAARARSSSWRTGHSRGRRRPRGSGSAAGCRAGPGWPGAAAAPGAGAPPAGRSTPRAAGPRAAAAPGSPHRPCRSSAAPRRSPCTAAGAPGAARSRSPPAARTSQPQPNAASNATGVPAGRSPISRSIGSDAVHHVLVQLHLAVLGDHRHLGALAVHVDSDVDRHCRVSSPELGTSHPERPATGLSWEEARPL